MNLTTYIEPELLTEIKEIKKQLRMANVAIATLKKGIELRETDEVNMRLSGIGKELKGIITGSSITLVNGNHTVEIKLTADGVYERWIDGERQEYDTVRSP